MKLQAFDVSSLESLGFQNRSGAKNRLPLNNLDALSQTTIYIASTVHSTVRHGELRLAILVIQDRSERAPSNTFSPHSWTKCPAAVSFTGSGQLRIVLCMSSITVGPRTGSVMPITIAVLPLQ
jgi:hypothetical protein